MPLAPSWQLQLHAQDLCNLDLLRRGLYRLRISVRGAEPVSCAAQPARLHSLSRAAAAFEVPDSDLGAEAGGISDEVYVTRSVLVRYVDERFDLGESVVFASAQGAATSADATPSQQPPPAAVVLIELLRADCDVSEEAASPAGAAAPAAGGVEHGLSSRFGRVRRVVRRTSPFAAVSSRSLELPARELLAGALPAAAYQVLFDKDNLASTNLLLQASVLALPFVAPPPPLLPPLAPLAGLQRASPPPQQQQQQQHQHQHQQALAFLASASASVAHAAAGFASALESAGFLDAAASPPARGDEALLASAAARKFVAACRVRLARPQSAIELAWPPCLKRAAARRAAACDEAAAALLALERGAIDAAEAEARVLAAVDAGRDAAADAAEPLAVSAAEAQAAHAALLAPLVCAHARLAAQARRVQSAHEAALAAAGCGEEGHEGGPGAAMACAGGPTDDGVAADEREAREASTALLREACPRAFDALGAALCADPADAATALDERELTAADAFGARGFQSFAARASAALGDHHSLARALAAEADCVVAELGRAWRAAQRDASRLPRAWSRLLRSECAARAARHVEAATEELVLASAAELLEEPLRRGAATGAEPRFAALATTQPYLLDSVTASVPAALRITRTRVHAVCAESDAGATATDRVGAGAAPAAVPPGSAHFVVFVNGLSGTVHDTRLVRAHIKMRGGAQLICHAAASVQGADTELDIVESGARLAAEVCEALARLAEDGLRLARLSFVAFSLGGVIARAAMRHPLLRPHVRAHAHAFVTLAAPHLGVAYAANSLFGAGLALRVRVRPSAALSELALADGGTAGAGGALLVALARGWGGERGDGDGEVGGGGEGGGAGASGAATSSSARVALAKHGLSGESNGELLGDFRRVVLVASAQDGFSPRESCLAQIPAAALSDPTLGHVYVEACRAFYGLGGGRARAAEAGIAQRFEKVDVRFIALEHARLSLDGVIGRDAHLCFLENEAFAAALAVMLSDVFAT